MNALDKDLINRCLSNTATDEESRELLRRLNEGELVHPYDNAVSELFRERAIPPKEQEAWFAKMNEQLVADNNIESPVVPIQGRSRSFVWAAAAAIILITMVTGLWISKQDFFMSQTSQLQEESKPSIYSGKQLVTLPDGSTVLLNESSELKFTNAFGTTNREVSLTGEALFDVKHDAGKPFIVHTGKVSTKVLGTSFNIKAYPGQHQVTVTVVRGLVQVGDDKRIYGKINPNQQISVNTVTNEFDAKDVNAENVVAWKNKFFILDRVTMAEAAVLIGERFNVNVTITNEGIKECMIGAYFMNNESLQRILLVVSGVRQASFKMKDGNVVIEGGIDCENE